MTVVSLLENMFVNHVSIMKNNKEVKMKTKMLIVPLLAVATMTSAHAQIWTDVTPYNSTCFVGQACQVGAVHSIKIVNDTPQPQSYHWFFAVQADNGDFVNKAGDVTLQPGQEWRQDKARNIGYMKFNMKGRKMLHCTTQADGYEHGTIRKDGWADVS